MEAVSSTFYYTAEGAIKYGEKEHTNSISQMGTVLVEYRSDHTFISTNQVSNDPKINELEGSWLLTGDLLKVTVDPKYHPRKGHESKTSSVSVTGNKMVLTENFPPNGDINKMETLYQKI